VASSGRTRTIPPLEPFPLPLLLPFSLPLPLPHDACGSAVLAWPGGGPLFDGHGGRAFASPDGFAVATAGFGVGFGVGRAVARAVGVGVRSGVGAGVGLAVGAPVGRPVGAFVGVAAGPWLAEGACVEAGTTFGDGEAAALAGDGIADVGADEVGDGATDSVGRVAPGCPLAPAP